MKEKIKKNSVLRSSSAEYLTFIAATGDGGVNAVYAGRKYMAFAKNDGNAI